jgi:hypothetical protein
MRVRGVKEHGGSSVLAQGAQSKGFCIRLFECKIFWMGRSQIQNILHFDSLDQNLLHSTAYLSPDRRRHLLNTFSARGD